MFGNIGPWELVLILGVALIVVGPGKLPEVARSMGKAANEFKKATSGVKQQLEDAMRVEDKPPVIKPEVVSKPGSAESTNSEFIAQIVAEPSSETKVEETGKTEEDTQETK